MNALNAGVAIVVSKYPNVPVCFTSVAAFSSPVIAARYSEVARLTRFTPAAASSATVNDLPRMPAMKFTGSTLPAHRAHRFQVRQARCHQHVRPGGLERHQAADRVVQVGVAAQEALSPSGQQEGDADAACGLGGGGDAVLGVCQVEQRTVAVAGRVLDRGPDQADRRGQADGLRRILGASPKPFSRSADTGRSVASTIARACESASARVTWPSTRPSTPAEAPDDVASAANPTALSMRADPASQALAMTKVSGHLVQRAEPQGLVHLVHAVALPC